MINLYILKRIEYQAYVTNTIEFYVDHDNETVTVNFCDDEGTLTKKLTSISIENARKRYRSYRNSDFYLVYSN